MSIKKTFGRLGAIVLLGTIGLTEAPGQTDRWTLDRYEIKHMEDNVLFREIKSHTVGGTILWGTDIVVTVTKPNGIIFEYYDSGGDRKINYFNIIRKNKREHYSHSKKASRLIMQEAQEQFDFYLKKIEEAKLQEVFQN